MALPKRTCLCLGQIGYEGQQVLHAPPFSPSGLIGLRPFKQNRLNSVAVVDIEPWNGINVVAKIALSIVIHGGRNWFQHSTHVHTALECTMDNPIAYLIAATTEHSTRHLQPSAYRVFHPGPKWL